MYSSVGSERIVSTEMIKNIHPISGQHWAGIWEELLAKGSCAGAAPSTVLSMLVTFLLPAHGQESLERRTDVKRPQGSQDGGRTDPAQPITPHQGTRSSVPTPFLSLQYVIHVFFFFVHSETPGLRGG